MNLTHTAEDFEFDGESYDLTLDVEFTCSPYDPGCTYGPPENCYPPEGGELEDLTVTAEKATRDGGEATGLLLSLIQAEVDRQVLDGGPLFDAIEAAVYALPPPEPDYPDDF